MKRFHVHVSVADLSESIRFRGMHAQLVAADAQMTQEDAQACCHAHSDKYWVTDPSGIAWEAFHTLATIPVLGEATSRPKDGARCLPVASYARSKACGSSCCA